MSLMHHTLDNVWTIRGELELTSPLHIGAGERGMIGLDAGVLKWPDGRPVIPGSSLKGVLRSFLETVAQNDALHTLISPNRPKACIVTDEPCGRRWRNKEQRDQWRKNRSEELYRTRDLAELAEEQKARIEQELAEEIYRSLCPVCRLFGNQLFAGKLSIPDLVPEGGDPTDWYDVRDGVGIDRDTRTAKSSIKYDFELVNPGVVFPLTIRAVNLEKDEQGWLLLAVEALRRGELTLGGKTSRGLGGVRGTGHWRISRVLSSDPKAVLSHYLGRDQEEDYELIVDQTMQSFMPTGR
ncbi:MAG TPA: CRISPR-associated RAMP protein [Alicyclobacillus sp.]|nr:CRISPR-associated RAMP protein [Alicyclobacillus sp.]